MSDNSNLPTGGPRPPVVFRPAPRPPASRLARKDRRAEKRCLAPQVLCQVLPSALPVGEAVVVNLSTRGAYLRLEGRVATGDMLLLRLSNREHLCIHEVTLQVTHTGGAAGHFLAGGQFVNELPPHVFRSLLA
jgi:hypothetical protein